MHWPFFTSNKKIKHTTTYIILAALIAMSISLWIGMQQSVWFDEAYSVLVAKHEPAEIISLVGADVHPPLYYLMLHSWGETFGWEDLPLRLSSVLVLGGSIIMAGLLVGRLFGDRAALTTVAMLAVAPLLLRYGFEIRMYALASLIGIVATYVLVRAREHSKAAVWLWALYAVLVVLGVLTLYHLALLWAAHVAWLMYVDWAKLRRFWQLSWVRAYAAAVVLFLPWLPTFTSQVGNGALANIGQPMNMEQLLGVFSFNMFYKPLWQVNVVETILMIVAVSAGCWAFLRLFKQKKGREWLLLVVAYAAIPILLFMLASFVRPLYVERYLSHVAIGIMILAGVLVAKAMATSTKTKQWAVYGVGALILAMGVYNLAVVGNFNFQRMQKPAVATTAQAIDCAGASVVAADPYVATELSYYLPSTCDLHFYSEWKTLGGGYAPFSGSPLRISTTKIPRLTNTLYYVYYDSPKLEVAADYHQINTQVNNGLTVVQYEAQ